MKTLITISASAALVVSTIIYLYTHLVIALAPVLHTLGM